MTPYRWYLIFWFWTLIGVIAVNSPDPDWWKSPELIVLAVTLALGVGMILSLVQRFTQPKRFRELHGQKLFLAAFYRWWLPSSAILAGFMAMRDWWPPSNDVYFISALVVWLAILIAMAMMRKKRRGQVSQAATS